ncbi:hypothetical protein BE04_48315 [Sorangium cellulosum]|uniref:Iminophenyl-pyruvate dimer synthase domain-containing protein n=1 Tax=Sorangium cellulosum TaxID=56 RepID=A0A150PDM4_SORCE|nr:hypothetical protein BE04_48315 [Sorangium cellulosum]
MSSRETLNSALSEAAAIEHGITCQYLFAAFSLKTHPSEGGVDWVGLERIRGWKAEILAVARQEMAHHGMLCNLLIVTGGAPQFQRPSFPHPVRLCPPHATFDLLPFSGEALSRFADYERVHAPDPAAAGRPGPPTTLGDLYRLIRDALVHIDRSNPKLFIGPAEHQITNRELRIRQGQFDVDLAAATDAASAVALIDRILEHDHHARFVAIQRELDELRRRDPSFEPARPVATNPRVHAPPAALGPATLIRHPLTRAAAELFNAAYAVMVLMLTRLYGRSNETEGEVDGLLRIAFFPLMTAVIRPLGEVLTHMPVGEGAPAPTAGPCFELPPNLQLQPFKRGAWVYLHEALQEIAQMCGALRAGLDESSEPWAAAVRPRVVLLHENLERLAVNFEEHMGLRRDYAQHMLTRMR